MTDVAAPAAAPAAEPAPAADVPADNIDSEINELEQEMAFMEKETQQVKDMSETQKIEDVEGYAEADKRSVYVGNVDYGATPEELQEHFKACGGIQRITIMVDKFTCCPKGFAYMEFVDEQAVQNAVLLNDSLFRGRQLKVTVKRSNIPGFNKAKGKGKKGKKGFGKKGYPGFVPYAPWGKGKGKGKYASPY